jgi:hypothetical protein
VSIRHERLAVAAVADLALRRELVLENFGLFAAAVQLLAGLGLR